MAALVGIFDRALWGPNEGPAGLTSDLYFSVELSEAATSIVTVAYEFIDGTARNGQDFTAANGVLTFEKGEQKKQIRVTVNGDDLDEQLEFFELRLKDAIGATIVKSGEYGILHPYSYAYLQDDDRGNPPLNYKIYSEKVLLNSFGDPLFGIVKLPPDILRFIDKPGFGASVIGFGDLNSDGDDDIVYAPSYQGDSRVGGTIKPLVMFFNSTKGAFEFDEQFQALLTGGRYPRRAVISDFDGDGRNDHFIGDTDEFQIVGGAQNQLYLQTKDGWVSATNRLPQYIDYTRCSPGRL